MRIESSNSLKPPMKHNIPHHHHLNKPPVGDTLVDIELDCNDNIVEICFKDFMTSGTGMIISNIEFNKYGQLIFSMTNGTYYSIDLSTVSEDKMNVFELQTLADLPVIGSDKTLYLIKQEKEIYYWDTIGYAFKRIGFDYDDISLITGGDALH